MTGAASAGAARRPASCCQGLKEAVWACEHLAAHWPRVTDRGLQGRWEPV